jgi:hypothetical protein
LRQGAGSGYKPGDVDAFLLQRSSDFRAVRIVTDDPHKDTVNMPPGKGYQGGGHRTATLGDQVPDFAFMVCIREFCDDSDRVQATLAQSDDICFSGLIQIQPPGVSTCSDVYYDVPLFCHSERSAESPTREGNLSS